MTALLSFLAATKIMVVAIKARSVGPERRPGARGDALGRADKVIRERPTPSPSAAEAIARTGLVGDGNRRHANRRPAATPPLVRGQLPPGAPFAPSRPLPRPPQRMFPARSLASATSSRSPSIAVLICDNTMRAVSLIREPPSEQTAHYVSGSSLLLGSQVLKVRPPAAECANVHQFVSRRDAVEFKEHDMRTGPIVEVCFPRHRAPSARSEEAYRARSTDPSRTTRPTR